jgi:hypothetical protein
MSVGEERAALRASVDAAEVTRSSIVTDLLRNACAIALRVLSPAAVFPDLRCGEGFGSATVLRLCLELMCFGCSLPRLFSGSRDKSNRLPLCETRQGCCKSSHTVPKFQVVKQFPSKSAVFGRYLCKAFPGIHNHDKTDHPAHRKTAGQTGNKHN